MLIKQLSLITLLSASTLSQALFSSDDYTYRSAMTTLFASPFAAAYSYYTAQQCVALRTELEGKVTGLSETLAELNLQAAAEEEKDKNYLVWVDRPAVYRQFLDENSAVYKQLMGLTTNSNHAILMMITSIAAGGFSWKLVQKY